MREDLEKLASEAYTLGRDFEEEGDALALAKLFSFLGELYPVAILEEAAKQYRAKLKDIENKYLPDLLMEVGLAKVTTSDGLNVGIKTEYNVSVLDPDSLSGWMSDNGGGHLWKNSLQFDQGEDISSLKEVAKESGISYNEKNEIHPMTLKKFVKDYLEQGGDGIPESAAIVKEFTHATIRRGK